MLSLSCTEADYWAPICSEKSFDDEPFLRRRPFSVHLKGARGLTPSYAAHAYYSYLPVRSWPCPGVSRETYLSSAPASMIGAPGPPPSIISSCSSGVSAVTLQWAHMSAPMSYTAWHAMGTARFCVSL